MSYQQVTLKVFKNKLKEGVYGNLTAAKRAMGRVQMSAADKTAAVNAATRHFGAPKTKTGGKKRN